MIACSKDLSMTKEKEQAIDDGSLRKNSTRNLKNAGKLGKHAAKAMDGTF